jgi:hypothetical protein
MSGFRVERTREWPAFFWLVVALAATTGPAQAHAPLPGRVALTPDGTTTALSLPGFGLLFRPTPKQPFVYLCDALLGARPSDLPPAMAFVADGKLLVGGLNGLRIVQENGCPLPVETSELGAVSVVALAVQPQPPDASSAMQTAYAVVGGDRAGLWRSSDGGRKWASRAPFGLAELTNAIVVNAEDPEQVYLSVSSALVSALFASNDGGATLISYPQEFGLTLLHAEPAGRLWAIARDAQTVGNRGFAVLVADGPAGPWSIKLRVNYFGGFVVDAQGVIWVGDEIGGLYRSDDGGETFGNLETGTDVACLACAGDALWACSPGLPSAPALLTLVAPQAPFVEVMAFDDVAELVSCDGLGVESLCAAAWYEWQRDVLMLPAVDAGQADAGLEQGDAASQANRSRAPSSCSLVGGPGAAGSTGDMGWVGTLGVVALGALVPRRR